MNERHNSPTPKRLKNPLIQTHNPSGTSPHLAKIEGSLLDHHCDVDKGKKGSLLNGPSEEQQLSF